MPDHSRETFITLPPLSLFLLSFRLWYLYTVRITSALLDARIENPKSERTGILSLKSRWRNRIMKSKQLCNWKLPNHLCSTSGTLTPSQRTSPSPRATPPKCLPPDPLPLSSPLNGLLQLQLSKHLRHPCPPQWCDGTRPLYPALLLLDICVFVDLDVVVLLLAHTGHDPVHGHPDVGVDLGYAAHVTVGGICTDLLVSTLAQAQLWQDNGPQQCVQMTFPECWVQDDELLDYGEISRFNQ